MGYYSTSTLVADSSGIRMSSYTSAARPANPVTGQIIYNTTSSKMELWDGAAWKELSDAAKPYLYRTIITTGYVYGGYKDSSPWTNVNRMAHATDVMTNLGNLLDRPAAYTSGANNLTRAFLWATDTAWPGTSTITSAFNMNTETGAGLNTNWNMRISRNDCGTVFKETEFAYITGGTTDTTIDAFNLTNETMYQANVGGAGITGSSGEQYGVGAFSDETAGYVWGGGNAKISFSTTSAYTIVSNSIGGSNGQQKGINSKVRMGWCGNEGTYNGGYNLRRYNLTNDTLLGTVAKPITNSGEENFDMGQAWQYMHGCYDGAQNNRSWKFNYSTESGSELGSGSTRTGVPGGSSGHCAWRA